MIYCVVNRDGLSVGGAINNSGGLMRGGGWLCGQHELMVTSWEISCGWCHQQLSTAIHQQ